MEGTYLRHLSEWVQEKTEEFLLDIYSYNYTKDVETYFNNLQAPNIRFFPLGINYQNIPEVIGTYHVGLIIYASDYVNTVHCAPNKLFEYLACGLDVWFPEEMLGIYPYEQSDVYPKVVKVDFKKLDDFDYKAALEREGLPESKDQYYYESVYPELYKALCG
jgi:hypothetical protein